MIKGHCRGPVDGDKEKGYKKRSPVGPNFSASLTDNGTERGNKSRRVPEKNVHLKFVLAEF